MNIAEEVSFDKEGRVERFPLLGTLFPALVVILVATLSFGLGRLSVVGQSGPIHIEYAPELAGFQAQAATDIQVTGKPASPNVGLGGVVGSRNGTKYHYAHCSGAKQIKEENRVIFASPAAAEAAGYALAANCLPK